jgi:hypothetical protein
MVLRFWSYYGFWWSLICHPQLLLEKRGTLNKRPYYCAGAYKFTGYLQSHLRIPRRAMFVLRLFYVTLAILWSAGAVSCFYKPYSCKKPAIRREWRALTTNQKAEWIRAVNVRRSLSPHMVAMLMPSSGRSACHTCPMTLLWRHPYSNTRHP